MHPSFFFTAFIATFIFIVILNPLALKTGLMDHPGHRKHHCSPTPLTGGLAVYLAILATLFIHDVNLPNKAAYIFSATILVCIGLVDDYKPLSFKVRLVAQVIVGLLMTQVAHIRIDDLGDLWNFGNFELSYFATAFTVFALAGGINAFNMADGIDGLVGGLTLIVVATVSVLAGINEDWSLFNYCLIFMGAIFVFLVFNLKIFGPATTKIFLGDTGSALFGFVVTILLIHISQGQHRYITPVTVLWVVAVPVIDSVSTMLRRISKGRSPFYPDRDHFHHILPLTGLNNRQTLQVILACSLVLTLVGVTASQVLHVPDGIMLAFFLFVFTGHYLAMGKINERCKQDRRAAPQFPMPILVERRMADRRVAAATHNAVIIPERRRTERRVRNIPIDFADRRKGDRRQANQAVALG